MKKVDQSLFQAIGEKVSVTRREISIAFKIAKRNVTRNKYFSAILILGIAATIALETGIVVSIDTLYDDFFFNARNQNFTDISIRPRSWTDLPTLRSLISEINSVEGVTRASPVYMVPVDRLLKQEFQETNILVLGIDPATHPDFSSLKLINGKSDLSNSNIIISQTLFNDAGLQIGSLINSSDFEIELENPIEFNPMTFKVNGVIEDPSFFGNNIGFLFVLMHIDTLVSLVPDNEIMNILHPKIDVFVKNLVDVKEISERIKDTIGVTFNVWIEKDVSDIEVTGIRAYQTALNLVILASFVVEFLFITNILAIAIRGRSKEFGILRAIGIEAKQLIASITLEILIYSIIGSILGLIGGITLAILLLGRMQDFYTSLTLSSLSLQFDSLIIAFSSGITVSLIAGLYPIFLALSYPIIQNIHFQMRSDKSGFNFRDSWKYTFVMGLLLSATGFVMQFFVGPTTFLDFEILSFHFFIVLLIFLGTVFVEISLLIFLPKIAHKTLLPFFDIITRTISIRNITREFQKSLFAIMTSALALTFIIIVGLVSTVVIASVPPYFQEQWGKIDLVAESRDGQLPDINLTDSLDRIGNVTRTSFIQQERTEIMGLNSYIFGVDPLKYSFFSEDVTESLDNNTYFYSSFIFLQEPEHLPSNITYCLMSELLYQKLITPVGSNVTIKIADNSTVNLTIAAIIKSNVFLADGEYLYISTQKFQDYYNTTTAKWFIFDVKAEGDINSIRNYLEIEYLFKEVLAIDYYASVIERSLEFQSVIFQILFIESFILAALTQFVCILVSTYRMEREMGIMRAIGLSRQGVLKIFMAESVALGFTALIVGIFDGLLGSILLGWYINFSIPVKLNFPLNQIVIWGLVSFSIVISSTLIPSYRSSRKNIAAVISNHPFSSQVSDEIKSSSITQRMDLNTILKTLDPDKKLAELNYNPAFIFPSISLIHFLKEHKPQILRIFFALIGINLLIVFIENDAIIRGMIPFDYIWRLFFSILPIGTFYPDFYADTFLFINPILLLISLTAIDPITYYFVNRTPPSKLFRRLTKSLLWGLCGVIICILTPFFVLSLLIIIIIPIQWIFVNSSTFSFTGAIIFSITLSLAIIGLEMLVFQRIWAYLVFRGISPELTFFQRITWLNKMGSKSQFKFVGLLVIHIFLQSFLFFVSQLPLLTKDIDLHDTFNILPFFEILFSNPLMFLILASFETGFFLLLIIFQLNRFINELYEFSFRYPLPTAKPKTIFDIKDELQPPALNDDG